MDRELGKEQEGLKKGRMTTCGTFALRQLLEKRLEKLGDDTSIRSVYLEKAFDTSTRCQGDGYGNGEMDGSARSRSQDGRNNV